MLAIRLQRTGRKGLAQYRVIVQEAHKSPKSERVVYRLGHYNPHTKEFVVDKEKAETYMSNGAQPSDKVARLFKANKVKLPDWVELDAPQNKKLKNQEKLRKNRAVEPKEEVQADTVEQDSAKAEDSPAPETVDEASDESSPAEEAENEVAVVESPEPAEAEETKDEVVAEASEPALEQSEKPEEEPKEEEKKEEPEQEKGSAEPQKSK